MHHTAGAARGNAPSLGVCISGRRDLPGPLCNVLIGRDLTCYVIAAGRANHAGPGSWGGAVGNSSVYGIEIENVGTPKESWSGDMLDVSTQAAAALADDRIPHNMICQHKEWAPRRKIDMHTISGDAFRRLLTQLERPHEPPIVTLSPESEEDEMSVPICIRMADGQSFYVVDGIHAMQVDESVYNIYKYAEAVEKRQRTRTMKASEWRQAQKGLHLLPSKVES